MTGLDELKIIVEEIIRKHETELQLASSVPWYDVYQAIKFVMRENPDLFWFSHQCKYDTDGVVHFHYTMDDERCETIKAQIDDVVEHDFKITHVRSLPKVEQVMYVYKWIALYCSYNILSAHNQTIYSVFVHHTSVCTGIAKAAQYLLNLLGIESRLVFGKMANSPKDSRHCWIIVKIENKWYHLDPTFALPDTEHILLTSNVVLLKGPDYLLYNYFCIDTKNIKLSRSIEEEDTLPNCIDTIDYKEYWNIDVLPSRNGKNGGLGCLLSDSGTTAISTKGGEIEEKRAKLKRKLLSSSKLKISPSDNLMTIPKGKLCGPSSIDDFATTSCFDFGRDELNNRNSKRPKSFFPQAEKEAENIDSSHAAICTSNILIYSLLKTTKSLFKWGKNKHKSTLCPCKVNTSVFAPSEVKHGDYMMVQVFLYMDEEEQSVSRKAKEVDGEAERRNYIPLSVKLKEGDKVKVFLQIPNKEVKVEEPTQELTWQGRFTDCQFAVYINKDFSASTLLSTVVLSINNSPVGRMMFKTKIADKPRVLYAEVKCKTFKKIFISYSHKDEARVKYIAEAYKAQGVDYFFDRHYLKAGDIYPVKIRQYIDSADLFILCWSKNAAESDYVALERNQALSHAYPQVSMDKASISIHPISIEPRTAYPQDMNDVYNFEEV